MLGTLLLRPRFRRLSFLILLSALLTTWPRPLRAYCPVPDIKPNGEFFKASMVFTGTVTSVRKVEDRGNEIGGWYYRIRVSDVFRGPARREITVFTEDASNSFTLELHRDYLLFAYRWPHHLLIDICGNSALLSEATDSLQTLRSLRDGKLPGSVDGYLYGETEGIDLSGVVITLRSGPKTYTATTDKDGWFHFPVPPGKYKLDLSSKEYYLNSDDEFWYQPAGFVLHAGECASLRAVSSRHPSK